MLSEVRAVHARTPDAQRPSRADSPPCVPIHAGLYKNIHGPRSRRNESSIIAMTSLSDKRALPVIYQLADLATFAPHGETSEHSGYKRDPHVDSFGRSVSQIRRLSGSASR